MARQVVIMPEGTRREPDDPPDYKPGAAALYGKLGVACVPFALIPGCSGPGGNFCGVKARSSFPSWNLCPGPGRSAFSRSWKRQ